MNPIALVLLAFAMSTDAFAAAIAKGSSLNRPRFSEALRMGLIFGCIEGLTPILGWLLGRSAVSYVEAWDHWLAFGLLLILGLHMIDQGLKPDEDAVKPVKHSFIKLVITAVGTSIDAMAVGVSLAFIEGVNIFIAAGLIGLATTIMVTIGVLCSRAVSNLFGHRAEIIGGITLICVGGWILFSHLQH